MSNDDDKPRPKAQPSKVLRAAKKKPPLRRPRPNGHRPRGAGTPLEERIAVAERRAKAWELSLAGLDPVAIGRALTVQDGRNPDGSLRRGILHGYDGDHEDKELAAIVRKDLIRALDERVASTQDTIATKRALMIQRHYRLLGTLWPALLRGDVKAHTAAIPHMRAIAKLDGLDEPTRVAVSGDDPDVLAAVMAIQERIRREVLNGNLAPTDDETGEPTDG